MDDTFWAALGSGLAAVIAVSWGEYLRWRSAQRKLKVSASMGRIVQGTDGQVYTAPSSNYLGNDDLVFFEARNSQTSSVTVVQFGFRLRRTHKSDFQVYPHLTFPYEVEGGKSLTEWVETKVLLKAIADAGKKPSDIKYVWFKSAAGREYRGKLDKGTVERLEELQENRQGGSSSSAMQQSAK